MKIIALLAFASLSGIAAMANAATLYDNIPGFPTTTPTLNGCSRCVFPSGGGEGQSYLAFSLSASSEVTGTDFAANTYNTSGSDDFSGMPIQVSIWDQALDSMIFEETTSPSNYRVNATPFAQYGYETVSLSLTNLHLAAGNYYISYYGDNLLIPGFQSGQGQTFQTLSYQTSDPGAEQDLGGATGSYAAFDLTSGAAAPEPAAWALMLVGFGGLGAALRTARGRRTVATG